MEPDLKRFDCLMKNCHQKFDDLLFYSRHLANYHAVPINIMYLKFKTKDDFRNWKLSEEFTNYCMFNRTQKEHFYRCHRSTFIMEAVRGDELLYKQNEEERFYKVKAPCPAHMKYEVKDDILHVMYVRTHYGYCADLKNLAISDETAKLVKKYANDGKLDNEKIVEKIRSEIKEKTNTDRLITTKHVIDILSEPN